MTVVRFGGTFGLVAFLILASLVSLAGGQTKDAAKDAVKDAAKDKDKKEPPPAKVLLNVQCNRENATYKVDEPAVFLFATTAAGDLEYKFTDDGMKVLDEGKLRVFPGKTFKLEAKLGHPGFLRLQLNQGTGTAVAAAAIEPTKIVPTAKAPEDFDAFWKGQLDALAKVRLDSDVAVMPNESTDNVTAYRVDLGGIDGRRVYGWVAVPKGTGPFPAILTVPYAGVYGIKPDLHHAKLGAVSMNIIIHDFPATHPDDFYKKQAENELKDYSRIGWDDKDKTYFRYAILACVRAIDYLANRKDVDPKQIAITGSSQGGALTLCVSGLDERVALAAPNVAGLCDLNARSQGRIDGWPHWLAAAPKDLKGKIEETSQYYDAVNFARKFKGKSLHGVGFLDPVCPPSTVYAAFNVHPEPKVMIDSPLMGHATDPRWTKARDEFFKENLTLKPPPEKKKK